MTHNPNHEHFEAAEGNERLSLADEISWEAFRYVLDDETLDREAFENRMQSDVNLALQVASAVSELQVVSSAVRSNPTAEVGIPVVRSSSTLQPGFAFLSKRLETILWSGSLGFAVCLLVAMLFSGWMQNLRVENGAESLASLNSRHVELETVANSWVAIEVKPNPSVAQVASLHSADGQQEAGEAELISNNPDDQEDADWILEAARQFYQENASGGVRG